MESLSNFILESILEGKQNSNPLSSSEIKSKIYSSKSEIEKLFDDMNILKLNFSYEDNQKMNKEKDKWKEVINKMINEYNMIFLTDFDSMKKDNQDNLDPKYQTTSSKQKLRHTIYMGFLYKDGSKISYVSPDSSLMNFYENIMCRLGKLSLSYVTSNFMINHMNPAQGKSEFEWKGLELKDGYLEKDGLTHYVFSGDNINGCAKFVRNELK